MKDKLVNSKQEINYKLYDKYYNKPSWWFNFRYRTRIKDLACYYLLDSISKVERTFINCTIFEIGFGHGKVLLSFDKSNRLIGAELSQSAILNAKKKANEFGFKDFLFYSVNDYPDLVNVVKEADLVIASHVLEHLDDDVAIIKNIYEILNYGGYFIVLIPINEYQDDPNHVRKYTLESCIDIHIKNGFNLVKSFEFDHAFSLFEKIYWGKKSIHIKGKIYRILWKIISIFMGIWSFSIYLKIDEITKSMFCSKPHQIGLLFKKIR